MADIPANVLLDGPRVTFQRSSVGTEGALVTTANTSLTCALVQATVYKLTPFSTTRDHSDISLATCVHDVSYIPNYNPRINWRANRGLSGILPCTSRSRIPAYGVRTAFVCYAISSYAVQQVWDFRSTSACRNSPEDFDVDTNPRGRPQS